MCSNMYWMEKSVQTGGHMLKWSSLLGWEMEVVVLGGGVSRHRRSNTCNCSLLNPGPVFAADFNAGISGEQLIYVVDSEGRGLWLTDGRGCYCHRLANIPASGGMLALYLLLILLH